MNIHEAPPLRAKPDLRVNPLTRLCVIAARTLATKVSRVAFTLMAIGTGMVFSGLTGGISKSWSSVILLTGGAIQVLSLAILYGKKVLTQ